MSHVDDLSRLEKIVNKLLAGLDAVRAEKKQLVEQLQGVSAENQTLKQELAALREEKSQVRQRVGGLIESIEKWEKEFVDQA